MPTFKASSDLSRPEQAASTDYKPLVFVVNILLGQIIIALFSLKSIRRASMLNAYPLVLVWMRWRRLDLLVRIGQLVVDVDWLLGLVAAEFQWIIAHHWAVYGIFG